MTTNTLDVGELANHFMAVYYPGDSSYPETYAYDEIRKHAWRQVCSRADAARIADDLDPNDVKALAVYFVIQINAFDVLRTISAPAELTGLRIVLDHAMMHALPKLKDLLERVG